MRRLLQRAVALALLLMLLLAWPTLASAAIAYVGGNIAHCTTSVDTCTVNYTPTPGNFIAVGQMGDSSGATCAVVTDSAGDTFTEIFDASGGDYRLCFDYICSVGAATSFTMNPSANTAQSIAVIELSGVAASGCHDQTSTLASGGSNSTQTGNDVTTTQADEVLIGLHVMLNSSATFTGTGGFTVRQSGGNATPPTTTALLTNIVSSTGTYHTQSTSSTNVFWDVMLGTFKAAAAGGGTATPPQQMLSGVGN